MGYAGQVALIEYVIKKLNNSNTSYKNKSIGRPRKYLSKEILNPLKQIWLATDQMCGGLQNCLKP